MTEIILPANNWQPFTRPFQFRAWDYLQGGGKRAALCWHRRAGKDDLALNWTAVAAHQRVGTYWHMLPLANQARRAIWRAVDSHQGKPRVDLAFPPELRKRTLDNEMLIEFKNGSTWQVVGSDNFDSLVGAPPVGIVFSEWALADPRAWAMLAPILAENGGWAVFIFTPRGRNHGHDLLQHAMREEDWYGEILSARDSSVFTPKQLDDARRDYTAIYGQAYGQAIWRQEYLCDFDAPVLGAFFAAEIQEAEQSGRVTSVPYDRAHPVITAWDLGHGDQTAIWFAQAVGAEIRLIDYYAETGQGIDHYINVVRQRGYSYGDTILPHDGEYHQLIAGDKTIAGILRNHGFSVTVNERTRDLMNDINVVRTTLNRCAFDETKCADGLNALRSYHSEYDEDHRVLRPTPVHNWASHGADAFRALIMGLRAPQIASAAVWKPRKVAGLV